MELQVNLTKNKKEKPTSGLVFGKSFTDHMFIMDYSDGKWHSPRITEYAPFSLDPATSIFHYGQGIFEGLKAFKNDKNEVRIFRPEENFKRLNESATRLCIPNIDEKFAVDSLKKLLEIDKDWIPTGDGKSIYIRPSIIAVDNCLGVHAAKNYIFFIIMSPVGAYYKNGLSPVKLYVEEEFVRASKGGTGHNKVIGNYAASLIGGEKANALGYDQVMWLDSNERKYVEEVGSMNIFFVIDNIVITPELNGSILPGITRKSIIELLKAKGYKVEERRVSIEEIVNGAKNGKCSEIFGTGTAAVVSPVGEFMYKNQKFIVNGGKMGEVSKFAYDTLTGIQCGKIADKFNWITKI